MNPSRIIGSLGLLGVVFASASLGFDSPAAAADPCATYNNCVAHIEAMHNAACAATQKENKNAQCPPLAAGALAHFCGPAPYCGPVSGSIRLKYAVTSVVYAPPGTAHTNLPSQVDYGTSGTVGTSISATQSFKQDESTTVTVGTLGPGNSLGGWSVGVTVSGENGNSSTQQLDVKQTTSNDIVALGPTTDGINHDADMIEFLLNPIVNITATGSQISWTLSADGYTSPQFALVGALKHPTQQQQQMFNTWGLTSADLATLLARDPLAWYPGRGPGVEQNEPPLPLDTARFTLTSFQCAYEPDPQAYACPQSITNDSTWTNSNTSTDQYSLGISVEAQGGLPLALKLDLKASQSWTWTNTYTTATSLDWKESLSSKISGPSASWGGPYYAIQVYFDTIYRTFLFMPLGAGAPSSLTGTIAGATGQPVPGAEVVVTAGGRHVTTVANSKGKYSVYGLPSGPATVSALGTTVHANTGPGARADVALPRGPQRK